MKIIILAFLFSLTSWAGNDVENGGDAVAFEFTMTARLAVENLKKEKLNPELKNLVDKISLGIQSVQVASLPFLQLQDREVDAINYPLQKRILVSRSRWKVAKVTAVEARIGLVLHEYLGVSHIDDNDYALSQKLVEALLHSSVVHFVAQESFLDSARDLAANYSSCSSFIPQESPKEICLFAGEIGAYTHSVTRWITNYPSWFRSEGVTDLTLRLKKISQEVSRHCLSENIDRRGLQESCERGYNLAIQLEDRLFSN